MENVKLGKLVAAVRRELTTNPLKAGVLALLLAVAAWFWGPIVWQTATGGKPPAQAPLAQPAARGASTPIEPRASTAGAKAAHWRELLAARRQDPLTQPAEFDPAWPQPFKLTSASALAEGGGEPAQVALTPAQAGLVLQSIVYGKTRRAAMINGEVYHEGAEIAAASPAATATFQIVRIDRTSVELERFGRAYTLKFPQPKLPIGGPSRPPSSVPAGIDP